MNLFGFELHQPMTCLTNFILAVECWLFFRLLKRRSGRPHGSEAPGSGGETGGNQAGESSKKGGSGYALSDWRLFFFFTGAAFLLGIPKHGFVEVLPGRLLTLVIYASSLSAGFGVLFAEWATILTRSRSRSGQGHWILASYLKVAVFGTVLAFTLNMTTVIVNSALGLVPIMVLEGLAGLRGDRNGRWIAGGFALSALAAPIHLMELGFSPWFIHDDLAHVIMMVTLWMVWRGVRGRG